MVLNMCINLTLQNRFMVLVMVLALQLQMCDNVSVYFYFHEMVCHRWYIIACVCTCVSV